MGPIFTGLIALPLLWITSQLWNLYTNYRAALTVGLPIIICPYDPENLIYVVASVPLRPLFKRLLPATFFATVELTIVGWEFRDKSAVHDRIGPAFMLVTTGLNQLICADPTMAHAILNGRREFVQPDIVCKVMGFLGSNILTVSSVYFTDFSPSFKPLWMGFDGRTRPSDAALISHHRSSLHRK
ncbi:hypothetical protein BDP81DRAFT_432382 [Colletotrichum phormii]|uniref:Uncharacterized protein n=1 Tax=Colletotrichum phormii TaxID=359342 RepID=A0AAI9ZP53_9PEZI|nr:uncharacterized protein BDP81DRAFT_432382 [Colletotrichum phormii]KAK1634217.1 hypothetical protein BDP81DRAFT_432382 [Colletotrichum phormii]